MKNKEIENEKEQEISLILRKLKSDFREWCAVLSIDEIMTNPPLIRSIERMDRILVAATG